MCRVPLDKFLGNRASPTMAKTASCTEATRRPENVLQDHIQAGMFPNLRHLHATQHPPNKRAPQVSVPMVPLTPDAFMPRGQELWAHAELCMGWGCSVA